ANKVDGVRRAALRAVLAQVQRDFVDREPERTLQNGMVFTVPKANPLSHESRHLPTIRSRYAFSLFQEKRAKSNVDREKGPTLLGELALTNEKYSWYELERDVVVDVLEVGRGLAAPGRTPGAPAPAAAGRRAAARPIAATAATADLAAA